MVILQGLPNEAVDLNNITRADDGTAFEGAVPRDADTLAGLYPAAYVKKSEVVRTLVTQAELFDIGANLTVIRCSAVRYNLSDISYVVVDLILVPTNTVATGATLLTFKPGFNPVFDQTFTGTRLIPSSSPIPVQVNARSNTRILECGGANSSILVNQTLYLNMRIEL